MSEQKVLLIGWDAADWRVIKPLLDQGLMPNLSALIERGTMGNLATLSPVLSPMLWTSIATGKRPYKHGVHGFSEPDPVTGAIRPVTNLSRKTKALWNILNQKELDSVVVGWWPSNPVEPLTRGVMVSNNYQRATGNSLDEWKMPPGTVHPPRLEKILADLRFHPKEIHQDILFTFLPALQQMNEEQLEKVRQDPRLKSLMKIIADATSIHNAATALLQNESWDFAAVYYDAIDHFGHGFMRFHPPRREWIDEEEFNIWKDVIESGYKYHDMLLGTLMHLAGEDTTIILMSDHGFHPDHMRPRAIPHEPAGPAVEHRQQGILVAAGPGIRQDELIHSASLLDICPTILHQFGLPVGDDMDGKVLTDLWEFPTEPEYIASWDDVEGDDGTHPADRKISPTDAKAALNQLVALGYIEDPGEDRQEALDRTVRELDFNLACAYIDGGIFNEAAMLLEKLYEKWPLEHRFGNRLTTCYLNLNRIDDLRAVTKNVIERRIEEAKQAAEELKSLKLDQPDGKKAEEEKVAAMSDEEKRDHYQRRSKLMGKASPNLFAMRYVDAFADKAEGKFDDALKKLEELDEDFGARKKALSLRGDIYLKKRDWSQAKQAYESVLALDPETPGAFLGLTRVAFAEKDLQAAVEHARMATGLQYHLPIAHYLLGVALYRSGDWQAAERAFLTSNRQAPLLPANYRMLKKIASYYRNDLEAAVRFQLLADQASERLKYERQKKKSHAQSQSVVEHSQLELSEEGLAGVPESEITTVVTGLPRSGTSLVMQILEAAGIPAYTDENRPADESNPAGYYENQHVTQLMNARMSKEWLADTTGKAVKVVAPLIPGLAKRIKDASGQVQPIEYRVILIERDMDEILDSQTKMLTRMDRTPDASDRPASLAAAYRTQLNAAQRWLVQNKIPSLRIQHRDLVTAPDAAIGRLAQFLNRTEQSNEMKSAIRPDLYRSRNAGSEATVSSQT